jgi:hypothetical protein
LDGDQETVISERRVVAEAAPDVLFEFHVLALDDDGD